jgi:hypothetical protein
MRTVSSGLFIFLLALGPWCVSRASAQAPRSELNRDATGASRATPILPANSPQPTRNTAFIIPFTIDQTHPSQGGPIEVQLLISTDRGANWHLYSRQKPTDGQFHFRAAKDGEYWFASRTIDAQNRARPEGTLRPELKYLIDTTGPALELTADVGTAGEIWTAWQMSDDHLDTQSLKIEYQTGPGQAWQPVAVELPRDDAGRTQLTGKMTWRPQTTSKVLDLRAEVRDTAGNATVVQRRVFVPRAVAQRARAQGGNTVSPPVDPFVYRRPVEGQSGSSNSTPAMPSSSPRGGLSADPAANTQVPAHDPYFNGQTTAPAGNRNQQNNNLAAAAPPAAIERENPSSSYSPYKPISSPIPASLEDRMTARLPGDPSLLLPNGERPRMTTSRQFRLDYDVDSVGPSGVASVELWGTSDGGHSWLSWGRDADCQSPFDVTVDNDGIYGFRVVIENRSGFAGQPPRSGDLADIWVGVDSTSPAARLTSAIYGSGSQAGTLEIHWTAEDPYLTARPVTLQFSGNPAGPWTTIVAGLANDGQYYWPVDPRIPPQIYLRLEVRDEAGNVGTDQLTQPISIEGLAPKGRIRGILPTRTPDASRDASRTHQFR